MSRLIRFVERLVLMAILPTLFLGACKVYAKSPYKSNWAVKYWVYEGHQAHTYYYSVGDGWWLYTNKNGAYLRKTEKLGTVEYVSKTEIPKYVRKAYYRIWKGY